MFEFVCLALLLISHSGDANMPTYSQRLSESGNDETFRAAYEEAVADFLALNRSAARDPSYCDNYDRHQIRTTIYSRSSPHGTEMTRHANYDATKPFKIIMQQKHDGEHKYTDLVTAYLRHHNEPVNVINVHYPKFFGCRLHQYVRVYDRVTETISRLVTLLHANGTSMDRIHLIGLGLSAHVAGSVAKMLKPLKIGRITGLDPLGGAFDRSELLGRLSAEDADFVDVISTNSRHFGTKRMRGTVQFYPNGGEIQSESNDFDSHLRARDYFVESVARAHGAFKSAKAASWTEYKKGVEMEESTYMGEYASVGASGKYFLDVNSASPFSRDGGDNPVEKDRDAYLSGSVFERARKALNRFEEGSRASKRGRNISTDKDRQMKS